MLLYIVIFSRFSIAIVFAISCLGKAFSFNQFERTILNFQVLPKKLTKVLAFFILAIELAIVIFLLIGEGYLTLGFILACILLIVFSIAFISVLKRRIQTSCNCFGPTEKSISIYDVWRNLGLILCAMVGGFAHAVISNYQEASLSFVELGSLGLASAIFVIIWLNIRDIVELFTNEAF